MRWSYKTVHYELKKEGLLGSAFLDESEVEQSLNEYGKAGWELVSLLETMDGLIAVFKQPLSLDTRSLEIPGEDEDKVVSIRQEIEKEDDSEYPEVKEEGLELTGDTVTHEAALLDEYEVVEETIEEQAEKSKRQLDIGTIRIE